MVKFVNLHAHTTFSINDGFGYPEDFMRTAFNKNMEAIAITDHGNMNALSYQVEAHHKLLEEGKKVKPIFGAEMYYINSVDDWLEKYQASAAKKKEKSTATVIEDEDNLKKKIKNFLNRRCHMLLLAQNQEGLYNLFEMVSKSYSENYLYRFPRIDFELLKRLNHGIIATSACLGGYYGSVYFQNRDAGPDKVADEMRVATEKILDIFGTARWFGELQWNRMPEQHDLNQYVIQMSQEFGFSLVSTSDAHFPDIKNWKDREIYKGLGWLGKKKKDIPETMEQMPYLLYPKSGDELWASYLDGARVCNAEYDSDLIRESIERTHDIAFNLIEDFLPAKNIVLPDFVVPEGKTEEEHLVELSIEGLKRLELHKKANYVERLKEELHIIKDRGFCKYFLTMKQVSDKAQSLQLAGPGRGSAAGSLTAYVLGITQVDPIRWNLLFSRFLRKDAKDYPDIDFDVSDPMSLKDALIAEWGQDRVVPISNWNKLQLKSLIKDISKYYDIPWSEVNLVTNVMMVESIPAAKQAHGIKAGVYIPDFEEVMKYSESLQNFLKKYPQVEEHVEALKGQIRSCSRHAGGVVISERLNRRMPLINSGGVIQTPWTEGQQTVIHLEPMGFIKFDVLGLASLRMIEGAIRLVLERHYNCPNPTFEDVKDFYNKNLHPDTTNFNDKKVWKDIFHCVSGQPGIFQLTQRGAQDFCEMVKPNNLEELTAITSVYRPGPMCLSGNTQILRTFTYYKDSALSNKAGIKRSTTKWALKDLYQKFNNKIGKRNYYICSYDAVNHEIVKNKVKNVMKSGVKDVYSITYRRRIEGGHPTISSTVGNRNKQHDLEATLDHKFYTKNGWKCLKDLKRGDYILVVNEGCKTERDGRADIKTIWGRKNFRNLAFYNYEHRCVFCNWQKGSLDVNHLGGNRLKNNNPENLCFLCPNHHREYTEGSISKKQIIDARNRYVNKFTKDLMFVKFLGKKFERKEETYDIEMEAPYNNFFAGSCVVHNSANVPDLYINAKANPEEITYEHPLIKKILKKNFGFIIFQEDLALLASTLGKNISLDEGNILRKLFIKKGEAAKKDKLKNSLHERFIEGCVEKKLTKGQARKLWDKMEAFSTYGFCRAHGLAYSVISFQCAWLAQKYPMEWACAFLEKEPEVRKERAINLVKSLGFEVKSVDINTSGTEWLPDPNDSNVLVQPLTSIKGLGEKAIEEIIKNRPFKSIEDALFNENVVYRKFNKKALDCLIRSQSMNSLMDSRFENLFHFWTCVVHEKPKTEKKLLENIEEFRGIADFTHEEKISYLSSLMGMFPLHLVIQDSLRDRLKEKCIPPVSDFDPALGLAWCVIREILTKKTKNKKDYYLVNAIDENFVETKIKCWGINPKKDKLYINRPYMVRLEYDPKWGVFNTRNHQSQLVYAGMNKEIKIGDLVKDSQGDIGLVVEIGNGYYMGRAVMVGVLLTERHKYLYGKKYHWVLDKLEKLS